MPCRTKFHVLTLIQKNKIPFLKFRIDKNLILCPKKGKKPFRKINNLKKSIFSSTARHGPYGLLPIAKFFHEKFFSKKKKKNFFFLDSLFNRETCKNGVFSKKKISQKWPEKKTENFRKKIFWSS